MRIECRGRVAIDDLILKGRGNQSVVIADNSESHWFRSLRAVAAKLRPTRSLCGAHGKALASDGKGSASERYVALSGRLLACAHRHLRRPDGAVRYWVFGPRPDTLPPDFLAFRGMLRGMLTMYFATRVYGMQQHCSHSCGLHRASGCMHHIRPWDLSWRLKRPTHLEPIEPRGGTLGRSHLKRPATPTAPALRSQTLRPALPAGPATGPHGPEAVLGTASATRLVNSFCH